MLGADDGVVSTASLMLGVAATSATKETMVVVALAGLVAGAMSMAAGEYVSVSSQRDAEQAAIHQEKQELHNDPEGELNEIAGIFRKRGLDAELAMKVAEQLSAKDTLEVHMREELRLDPAQLARPIQAAFVSALSFGTFAALPIVALILSPASLRAWTITLVALVSLGLLGAFGGWLGGAPLGRASVRVLVGGGLAMGASSILGHLLHIAGY